MRIGTRKSTMALAQTEEIARRLAVVAPDLAVEIVKFEPVGDRDQTSNLLRHGGKGGAFVGEIRAAVLKGSSVPRMRADLAGPARTRVAADPAACPESAIRIAS